MHSQSPRLTPLAKGWITQTTFNRYVVGRPNPLFLPLKVNVNKKNFFINKASDFAFKVQGLWV
jgi:hypothetical protein